MGDLSSDLERIEERVKAMTSWLAGHKVIKSPSDVQLRAKLERKLAEYAARLKAVLIEGEDPPASDPDSLDGYYKFVLLDAVLRAEGEVNTDDVVLGIMQKHGLVAFDPLSFMNAHLVILKYLGITQPGANFTGGTGL